jgi:hypothetical protein
MKLLMQDEDNAVVNQKQRMMFWLSSYATESSSTHPSPGWLEGWEDEEQESTSTCRCSLIFLTRIIF